MMIRLTRRHSLNRPTRHRIGTAYGHVDVTREGLLDVVETPSVGIANALERMHGFERTVKTGPPTEPGIDLGALAELSIPKLLPALEGLSAPQLVAFLTIERDRPGGPRKGVLAKLAALGLGD